MTDRPLNLRTIPDDVQSTHWETCYREHVACAAIEHERLTAALATVTEQREALMTWDIINARSQIASLEGWKVGAIEQGERNRQETVCLNAQVNDLLDDNERLTRELAAARERVGALEVAIRPIIEQGPMTPDITCAYCGDVLFSHSPDCSWIALEAAAPAQHGAGDE